MKQTASLTVLALLFLAVLVLAASGQDAAWLSVRWSDFYQQWNVNWAFTYDEQPVGAGFILTNYSGQNVCRFVGTPTQSCDCYVAWEGDDGYGSCLFDEGSQAMSLFRLPDGDTCTIVLWWETNGHARELARYVGPCRRYEIFLPYIGNN